jgi:pimeloyl-ACP methyl ester carboxylesterase
MSLLNSVKKGLDINRLVIIGSGDIVKDIIDDFVQKLELEPQISDLLETHFEKNAAQTMNSYSSFYVAQSISIPVLIIHDENDNEVPVKCAYHIHENLKNSTLLITKNLGHRKILGDRKVIEKVIHFIKNQP